VKIAVQVLICQSTTAVPTLMPGACRHHSDPGQLAPTTGRKRKELLEMKTKPLLFVDIDGVISLFGFPAGDVPARCSWHQVDGIVHLLSHDAADHLLALGADFELVWCSGWKDRANDHLPHVLGLGPYPHLTFGESPDHWKLAAVMAHAGSRPLAWIDDDVNDAVRAWARERAAPTLIVETAPSSGLTAALAEHLRTWAQALDR
jgi:hypothetical protein